MAVILNASTTAGLVTSADTSGNLDLQAGGVTKIAVTSAGVAVTGTLSASGGFTGNATTATTATALTTATGSAPSYSARAWVNFNGTGTVAIRASGNVSSITDSGVGLYIVNFTTALPDANYAYAVDAKTTATGVGNINEGATLNEALSTTSLSIRSGIHSNNTATDCAIVTCTVFR